MRERHENHRWLIICFCAAIVVIFGLMYFPRAYGTWGDDSDGYHLGSHYLEQYKISGIPSESIQRATAANFSAEEVDLLVPTRYGLTQDADLVYRYPYGISLYISYFKLITGSLFNILIPIFAVASLIVFFLILTELFADPISLTISFCFTFAFGVFYLFAQHAVSQTMTEIPSIFLILLTILMYIKYLKSGDDVYLYLSLLFAAFSVNIRIPNILILSIYLPLAFDALRQDLFTKRNVIICAILVIVMLPAVLINLENSSSPAPQNIDHVGSIGIKNMFNNQGRYRAGEGSFNVYLRFLRNSAFYVFLVGFALYIFRRGLWELIPFPVLTFILYSMWVNPYDRYLLPALVIFYLFMAIGAVKIADMIKDRFLLLLYLALLLLLFIPKGAVIERSYDFNTVYNKALTAGEYAQLERLKSYQGTLMIGPELSDQQGMLQNMFDGPVYADLRSEPDLLALIAPDYLLTSNVSSGAPLVNFTVRGVTYGLYEVEER
jgi:hypothetical protein